MHASVSVATPGRITDCARFFAFSAASDKVWPSAPPRGDGRGGAGRGGGKAGAILAAAMAQLCNVTFKESRWRDGADETGKLRRRTKRRRRTKSVGRRVLEEVRNWSVETSEPEPGKEPKLGAYSNKERDKIGQAEAEQWQNKMAQKWRKSHWSLLQRPLPSSFSVFQQQTRHELCKRSLPQPSASTLVLFLASSCHSSSRAFSRRLASGSLKLNVCKLSGPNGSIARRRLLQPTNTHHLEREANTTKNEAEDDATIKRLVKPFMLASNFFE